MIGSEGKVWPAQPWVYCKIVDLYCFVTGFRPDSRKFEGVLDVWNLRELLWH